MKIKKLLFLTALFAYIGTDAQTVNLQEYTLEKPYTVEKISPASGKGYVKNVILMIGDGMSLMHIQAAWTCNRGHLWLENAQATGLSKTPASNRLITDSGSGGTSLATGYKTIYHAVGVDADGKPLTSLCTLAKTKGKDAGIAVTCRLWDATPCDFCCHNIDRNNEQDLVADYLDSNIDYAFGGGAKYFEHRTDGRNIFNELKSKGYHISRTWEDLQKWQKGKVFCVPYDVDTPLPDERGDLLARAALKGMNLMNQNKNGFFMMIEGSQLDDYGHFNQLDMLMKETLDFDRTVGEVMKWAAKDGQTLVVITADHETGGMTVHGGNLESGTVVCNFSTKDHSGTMVPVYAFGPGSEQFTGFMDNTDIFWKIKKLMDM
ncbi:alkaline phosphatase [Hoylesella oralis]|uniref:alkaline phosphatase n=1 Tax=Hoylesella oralis TaxID=28134 RepID=UPI00360AAE63